MAGAVAHLHTLYQLASADAEPSAVQNMQGGHISSSVSLRTQQNRYKRYCKSASSVFIAGLLEVIFSEKTVFVEWLHKCQYGSRVNYFEWKVARELIVSQLKN